MIYHCNYLVHEQMFSNWRISKGSVSDTFRWKSTFLSAAKLQFSKKFKEGRANRFRLVEWNQKKISVNIQYAQPNNVSTGFFDQDLIPLLNHFEKIHVVRVLCKEEVIGRLGINSDLKKLSDIHEKNWHFFIKEIEHLRNINFEEWSPNDPELYLSHDSHLSELGNIEMANFVDNIIK